MSDVSITLYALIRLSINYKNDRIRTLWKRFAPRLFKSEKIDVNAVDYGKQS